MSFVVDCDGLRFVKVVDGGIDGRVLMRISEWFGVDGDKGLFKFVNYIEFGEFELFMSYGFERVEVFFCVVILY